MWEVSYEVLHMTVLRYTYDATRYEMLYVRSKADLGLSQFKLPHEIKN